jgi:hypothetical protein
MKYSFSGVLLFLLVFNNINAQEYYISGQLSSWVTFSDNEISRTQFGIRYIPSISLQKYINEANFMDVLISLNGYVSGNTRALKSLEDGSALKPYRTWIRYASRQWEVRLGLQKISFGPAMLIRPLMWFDHIDPRDPLKITSGVYAALFRYYFLNNANIWIWGLYGNANTKGWEFLETEKDKPEIGGRFQYPLGMGELAVSYHYRRFVFPQESVQIFNSMKLDAPEHRFAIDGKWDYEIGFWFEACSQYQKNDFIPLPHQTFLTYGIDYTFDVGNGLNVLGENFLFTVSEQQFGSGPTTKLTSLLLNYPVGLLDQVRTIIFYDWENQDTYSFIGWQRSYDNWVFYLNLFWNPDQPGSFNFAGQSSSEYTGGKGFQILVVYNH